MDTTEAPTYNGLMAERDSAMDKVNRLTIQISRLEEQLHDALNAAPVER